MENLLNRIDRLSEKVSHLEIQLRNFNKERIMMENKINDAQTRIQKILSRLPQAADTRQLNLLEQTSESTHES
ncbi:MAG: hypothetical protein WCK52_11455 [Betaproteobacteria bacterium]|jgi:predicted  nucleic acid-binding Zn-ribbon protein